MFHTRQEVSEAFDIALMGLIPFETFSVAYARAQCDDLIDSAYRLLEPIKDSTYRSTVIFICLTLHPDPRVREYASNKLFVEPTGWTRTDFRGYISTQYPHFAGLIGSTPPEWIIRALGIAPIVVKTR